MEEQELQEEQQTRKEPMVTKSTITIVVAFAIINIVVILAIFGGSIFGGGGGGEEGEGAGVRTSPLEDSTLINLGRVEVSMPLDPMHQNYMHCSANISLMVPSDRQQVLEPLIRQNDAIFKELAREAFRNAGPGDLATENLAGVKNAIKRGVNELLGEEGVQQVVFGDYRPY